MSFVFFDVETTGLSPDRCQIIELAGIKTTRSGGILSQFHRLVKSPEPLPEVIIKLTGHTDEELAASGIELKTALMEFFEWVGDPAATYLVAHNAPFDAAFVRKNAIRESLPVPNYSVIDTLQLAKKTFTELKKHKLGLLLEHVGITLENAHTADADTMGLYQLFGVLIKRMCVTPDTLDSFLKTHAREMVPMADLNDIPPWNRRN